MAAIAAQTKKLGLKTVVAGFGRARAVVGRVVSNKTMKTISVHVEFKTVRIVKPPLIARAL